MPLQLLYDYALQFVGLPYRWGGAHPSQGVDCSELVQWLLKPYAILPRGDQTAQSIFNYLKDPSNHSSQDPQLGACVFYGNNSSQVCHIGLALSSTQHIEAAGGDHTTTSLERAIAQKAWVRITPIRFEGNYLGCFMPDYPVRP